jgi:hypothetical protein
MSVIFGVVTQGVALSLTAGSDMHITGTLSTSGQGPLDGPGAPSEADMGNGGTYGGSGGILDCHEDYYTAPAQVGILMTFTAVTSGNVIYHCRRGYSTFC